MSPVQYVSPETPRTEFAEKSPFFFKDISFSFEQEFRLLINLSMFLRHAGDAKCPIGGRP